MAADHDCPAADPASPYPGDCDFTSALRRQAEAREQPAERGYVWKACFPKAKLIKLLLLDVDGVLTDGSLTYTHTGDEIKTFHCRDGFGITLLRESGVEVGLITARQSEALLRRARDLHLTHVYQGKRNKTEVFRQIIAELHLRPEEVAYMGDDWLDLSLLRQVGFSATVADGCYEVRQEVDYVARAKGGRGAVREVCDLLVEARGKRESLLADYRSR